MKKVQEIRDLDIPREEKLEQLSEHTQEKGTDMIRILGAYSGEYALSIIPEKQWPFALRYFRDLCKEYDLQSPSELTLAQMATAALCRAREYQGKVDNNAHPSYISHEHVKYLSEYRKEADRNTRQYMSALQSIQQMKRPHVSFTVQAKTAFVAQNQQNNTSSFPPEHNDPQ